MTNQVAFGVHLKTTLFGQHGWPDNDATVLGRLRSECAALGIEPTAHGIMPAPSAATVATAVAPPTPASAAADAVGEGVRAERARIERQACI